MKPVIAKLAILFFEKSRLKNIGRINPPAAPIIIIDITCDNNSGGKTSPEPNGFRTENMNSAVPPTNTPQLTPSVSPAKKTITVINSTFGTINNENPKPIARLVNIEARTNLFRFIVLTCQIILQDWNTKIITSGSPFSLLNILVNCFFH